MIANDYMVIDRDLQKSAGTDKLKGQLQIFGAGRRIPAWMIVQDYGIDSSVLQCFNKEFPW